MRTLSSTTLALAFILGSFGCASVPPPPELLDARAAFARASAGPARDHSPADLETARKSVQAAEKAYSDDPKADKTRDLAYVASRKVLTAEARGRRAADEKARTDAEAQFRKDAVGKLDSKNSTIETERQRAERLASQGAQTSQALQAEQIARIAAEKKAKDAMDRLSALAAIKEDPRGTIITLSGSVLFATNKSDLLPNANERLNQVADALNEQPDRRITVLGHTDAQGEDAYNQKLSERRAESVRAYLVSRGIAADRISAVGKGEADPVADNKNVEGRANNRRVEIIMAPKPEQK